MRVEVLYFEGCPNHPPTAELTRAVIAELGIGADVEEIRVQDANEAERLRFIGSPTVRVDGVDIEPGAESRTHYTLSCRTYGASGMPPRELLVAALSQGG